MAMSSPMQFAGQNPYTPLAVSSRSSMIRCEHLLGFVEELPGVRAGGRDRRRSADTCPSSRK